MDARPFRGGRFTKNFSEIYEKTKSTEELDMEKLFKVISALAKTSIVITKNQAFADKLRENISLFEKKEVLPTDD